MNPVQKPVVLFVCVKNSGKSQMAAGLLKQITGDAVEVYSAGTRPGTEINGLSAEVLMEDGVDITAGHPESDPAKGSRQCRCCCDDRP